MHDDNAGGRGEHFAKVFLGGWEILIKAMCHWSTNGSLCVMERWRKPKTYGKRRGPCLQEGTRILPSCLAFFSPFARNLRGMSHCGWLPPPAGEFERRKGTHHRRHLFWLQHSADPAAKNRCAGIPGCGYRFQSVKHVRLAEKTNTPLAFETRRFSCSHLDIILFI